MDSLLPPVLQDARGRAVEAMFACMADLDLAALRIYDVDHVPANALPALAWQFGVLDLFNLVLDEAGRRGLIKNAIALHRRMGTLAGLRQLASYAGGAILRVVTPPSKTFCAPSMTVSERNAWLARMPQLRFYKFRGGSSAGHAAFCGWQTYIRGHRWPLVSDAISRIGTRPALWDRGAETWLVQATRETVTESKVAVTDREVRQPSVQGYTSFPGFPPRLCSSDAAARIYTVRLLDPYQEGQDKIHLQAAIPSLSPVSYVPEAVAQVGTRRGNLFPGASSLGSRGRSCLLESTAGDRIFDRIYLHDPERALAPRGRSIHLGDGCRMGMPPHNAELVLSVPGAIPSRCVSRFVQGYLKPADTSRWCRLIGALNYGKRLSDRVLARALATRQITSGPHLSGSTLSGTFAAH